MKSGDSSVYIKIINAAEHPHLSIPETEFVRKRKQHQQLLHTFIFALGEFIFSTSHQNLIA
jgi:Ras family protein T1